MKKRKKLTNEQFKKLRALTRALAKAAETVDDHACVAPLMRSDAPTLADIRADVVTVRNRLNDVADFLEEV